VDRVNGVNAAELVKKVRHHAGLPASSNSEPTTNKVRVYLVIYRVIFKVIR